MGGNLCISSCLTNALDFCDLEETNPQTDKIPDFRIQKEQRKGTTIYTSKKPLASVLGSC